MARVLLATHDTLLFDTIDAELSGEGHETLLAGDGPDAYAYAQREPLSLALLDVSLPVFSGPELCGMIAADPDIPDHLPIYLLSDEPLEPHVIERVGAAGIFPKSHGAHELRELVSGVIMREPFVTEE